MSTITINVHEAKDLIAADANGKSDPYAIVFVGKNKPQKTKIVKKNLSPKWEESFEFPLSRHDKTLQVQVWDWDRIGSDDFLGLVHVDLSMAATDPSKIKDGWLKLQPHPQKKVKVKGGVKISISVQQQTYAAKNPKQVGKVVLGKISDVTTNFDISGTGASNVQREWVAKLPDSVTSVNFSFNKLTAFPNNLDRFATTLRGIWAAGNMISSWPIEACCFTNVTEIELNGNELKTLPAEFARMNHVEKLNLSNNKLVKLPGSIGGMWNLEELNLSGNELTEIPETFGNLYRLEVLDLSCCNLRSVPEELTYATRLIELNLGGNKIQALPQAVGRFSRMVNLNIADNLVKDVPISIGYCASLSQIGQGLGIDRNPLQDKEMAKQYRIGSDRLFMYLEKRMMMQGMPKLPPFPNDGIPPYVPLPPVGGEYLEFQPPKSMRDRIARQSRNSGLQASPISMKNRGASPSSSPQMSRPSQKYASKEEKVDKIRTVAKAVIQKDIQPKLARLRQLINAASSVQQVQPYVLKVKSLKGEFETIKRVLPPLDKPPAPTKEAGESKLTTVKKVVGVILFEYDLTLSIASDVVSVASSKDLVTMVNCFKKLKSLLH